MKKILILLFITLTTNIFSQIPLIYNDFDFKNRMELFNIPGLSISIIENREISWSQAFGNVNQDTVFQASNFSKPITAFAIMKLVDEGLLDLDIDVNKYLKSWQIEETPVTRNRKVTLRMLLSHTSGIHESGPKGYLETDNIPTLDQILQKIHIRYYPGLKRRYSWSGFSIIQKIIEDVSGDSYADYISKNILIPLNMDNSSFEKTSNTTPGYDLYGNEIDGIFRIYPELAASGLWTTPTDMAKFIIEIQNILTSEYEGIISKNRLLEMLSYQKGGWGLGVSLKFDNEDQIIRHSGKNAGFTNYFISRIYKQDGIIIMTNGDNGWNLIMEILHSIDKYKDWGI